MRLRTLFQKRCKRSRENTNRREIRQDKKTQTVTHEQTVSETTTDIQKIKGPKFKV